MVRILLILFFSVFAFGYDELLLEAQSAIVPKIALLDKDIPKKLVNGKILVVVAYDTDDSEAAREVVSKINAPKNRPSAYPAKAVAVEFSQLSKTDMSILYIMRSGDANVKKAVNIANQKGVISFSYDKSDIANGVMLSMNIERSAVITLKRSALKDAGVQFSESFYKMVRIVD